MVNEVFIISAVRTPIGSLNGVYHTAQAHELGAACIRVGLQRAGVPASDVSEVIMGQVLSAGHGMNPARQASMGAEIPYTVPAYGINLVCGSGLKSVSLGVNSILTGNADIVVAGGQECMSQAPHTIQMRNGVKFGDVTLKDSIVQDGLTDAFHCCHMGITAENVAQQYNISREEQDALAYESQQRAATAITSGFFESEIIPISQTLGTNTNVITKDQHPRPDTTIEKLARLKPAFDKNGTVTAGNASGMNDGASVVVLASDIEVKKRNLKPLAKIVSYAQGGVLPNVMGLGPIPAIKLALEKASWKKEDVDLFEINEAFAVLSIAVAKELGIDSKKVNTLGGAIALGHPLGASGTRILTTLVHSLHRTGGKKGVASLCVGGGMGVAMCIETV